MDSDGDRELGYTEARLSQGVGLSENYSVSVGQEKGTNQSYERRNKGEHSTLEWAREKGSTYSWRSQPPSAGHHPYCRRQSELRAGLSSGLSEAKRVRSLVLRYTSPLISSTISLKK